MKWFKVYYECWIPEFEAYGKGSATVPATDDEAARDAVTLDIPGACVYDVEFLFEEEE